MAFKSWRWEVLRLERRPISAKETGQSRNMNQRENIICRQIQDLCAMFGVKSVRITEGKFLESFPRYSAIIKIALLGYD